ncbi:MAG: DUF1499 domain-containing protein [Nitrospirae bacterium]|nr:DUF1499 domain-containing protein [Nitrospirota bacterium]
MDRKAQGRSTRPLARLSVAGLALAAGSGLAAVLSGFGSHAGIWKYTAGIKILGVAAVSGGVSSIIALVGLALGLYERSRKELILSSLGLVVGLVVFAIPFSWYLAAKHLPMIHDITTDTENPPQFEAIIPLRKKAANPYRYGGPEIARKQREAYPDIEPLVLGLPPEKTFEKALAAARRMRWNIIEADRERLRIEATDTTFWFGFRDDIVVRIIPLGEKSRVDVRSESRVGISDIGTNAERIRKYLKELSKKG